MNKAWLYIVGVLALLFLGGVVVFQYSAAPAQTPAGTDTNATQTYGGSQGSVFRGTPAIQGQGTQAASEKQITVAGAGAVRDFSKDTDIVPITSITRQGNPSEMYYSLGTAPYEPSSVGTSSATVPSALDKGYEILYFPSNTSFSIFLYKEPVSDVRKAMAADLAERLNIPDTALCNLAAFVWVSPRANTFYSGKNVGFPGCPGAVKFPGD